MHKTSKVHISYYFAADWVERRKKKMIVLQEFDALDDSLEFTRADGAINNEKWKEWKRTHVVLVATWSILLYVIIGVYFGKRLMNEGKLKRACEFQEKFHEVLHFLWNFLRMILKFKTLKHDLLEFGWNWTYKPRKGFCMLSLIFKALRGTVFRKITSKIPILVFFLQCCVQ